MSDEHIYNPLDKAHLAESIVREFFKRQLHPLAPSEAFPGTGIYALYYRGDFPLYREISKSLERFLASGSGPATEQPTPVYIGKSDPPGSRKGSFEDEAVEGGEEEAQEFLTTRPKHRRLYARLRQHQTSISLTKNLKIEDFRCRYMLVDEVWVALGEARLVDWFKPLWNVLIEGFGSKVEGSGRGGSARSVWDILHPGRKENLGIQVASSIEMRILADIRGAKTREGLKAAIKAHRDARRQFRKDRKKSGA